MANRGPSQGDELERMLGKGDEYDLKPPEQRVVADPKILEWRWEQLRSLGFGEDRAEALARDADVDLARARRLVRECGSELAWRILA